MMGVDDTLGGCGGAGRPRARSTRCLPYSYQPHTQGPVSHALGDTHQHAGEFPHGRRRISAAGDLRLHRPSPRQRRTGQHVSRRCCPRTVRRLVLRNVTHARAALRCRRGLEPDGAWCRTRARARDAAVELAWVSFAPRRCCLQAARPRAPVLSSPKPGTGRHSRLSGIPDPLLSRLEVQHASRSISTVARAEWSMLWADAPTRAPGSRRGTHGRPAPLDWDGDEAQPATPGAARSIAYRIAEHRSARTAGLVPARLDARGA